MPMIRPLLLSTLTICFSLNIFGQFDFEGQLKKNQYTAEIIDPTYGITIYEPLNLYLFADSTRIDEGYAANGWKEDYYSDGSILHKGYYIEGQLKVYKNFYPNGNVERNFKSIDSFKSKVTLFYESGNIKSKVIYSNDFAMEWIDYYENEKMSYIERYNKDKVSHDSKISYYENGNKQEELIIENKKKKLYLYLEYFQNGEIKLKGHLRFDNGIYDYVKFGTWNHYDKNDKVIKKDHY